MAKLESAAEARQEEATLERLRKKTKTAGSGRAGMLAGSGSEAGSDYTAYVQSRLKDAFYQTINYTSKNPEAFVHLYIDTDGKVIRQKIEKSTGDHTFELAVQRAIEKAGDKLVPPPNHKVFEGAFLFKPPRAFPVTSRNEASMKPFVRLMLIVVLVLPSVALCAQSGYIEVTAPGNRQLKLAVETPMRKATPHRVRTPPKRWPT